MKINLLSFFVRIEKQMPLGRWHNVGERYKESYLKLKEVQKYKRQIYKENRIDPYSLYRK
jgi:hypothetical protein